MAKNGVKRFLSLMLALILCITYMPSNLTYVFAEDEGDGQESSGTGIYSFVADEVFASAMTLKNDENGRRNLDSDNYFWVDTSAESANITNKTAEFWTADKVFKTYDRFLKVGSKITKNKVYFTVSDGKYCELTVYVRNGVSNINNPGEMRLAVFKTEDNSKVEGSELLFFNGNNYATVSNLEAGDYYIAKDGDYEGTASYYRIDAVETDEPVQKNINYKDWDLVESPYISTSYVATDDKNTYLYVEYNMEIGPNGADYIEGTLYDFDGNVVSKYKSNLPWAEIDEYGQYYNANADTQFLKDRLAFKMTASDRYTCKMEAKRYSGEVKESNEITMDIAILLTAPEPYSASNIGGGLVKVEFGEVKEAGSYVIEYKKTSEGYSDWKEGALTYTGEGIIYGLEIGCEYEFRIVAYRGADKRTSDYQFDNIKLTVSEEAKSDWIKESIAGASTNSIGAKKVSSVVGDINNGENVTIISKDGKIVDNVKGSDGITSSYIKVKADSNITISSHIKVDEWTSDLLSNGFGLYVADQNFEKTNGWNNVLYAGAFKVSAKDSEGVTRKYALGIGSKLKQGLDAEELDLLKSTNTITEETVASYGMSIQRAVLEDRYPKGKESNIIGGYTNTDDSALFNDINITEFDIEIKKVGSVYTVKYTSSDGYTNTNTYDTDEALTTIDSDYVYIGLFAARGTTIVTFSNTKLEVNSNADYSLVEKAIAKADGLNPDAYVDFSGVRNAINDVDWDYTYENQGKVLIMAKNIEDAINKLVLKPIISVDEDGTQTTITSSEVIAGGEKVVIESSSGIDSYVTISNEPDEAAVDSKIITEDAQVLVDSILNEEEKTSVQNGEQVSLSLNVVKQGEDVSKAESDKIEKELKKQNNKKTVGAVIDIKINKTIGNKKIGIREIDKEIKISIKVPTELAGVINKDGVIYKVARNHEGTVELLDAVYDAKTNSLSFMTKEFSTYAITLPEMTSGDGTETDLPEFTTNSLTLGDEIGVNYYITIPDSVKQGSSMTFTVSGRDGKTETQSIDRATLVDSSINKYKFTVGVNALQMADTITATFNYGDNSSITKEYSVKDYVELAMTKDISDKLRKLLMTLSDYGYYSQKLMSSTNGWTMGVDHKEMLHFNDVNIAKDLSAFAYREENSISGLRISQSLRLDSKTEIVNRIYVTSEYGKVPEVVVKDKMGNLIDVEVSLDAGASLKSGEVAAYKIVIPSIYAHMLGDEYQVIIDGTMKRYESVNSYANSVLTNTASAELKQAVVAMYDYSVAAVEYKNN